MASDRLDTQTFVLGEHDFDHGSHEICRGSRRWKVPKQCSVVLAELVIAAPSLVDRQALARLLWPRMELDDVDDRLNHVISRLRATLADVGIDASMVDTRPGVGYRYLGPVSIQQARSLDESARAGPRIWQRPKWLAAAVTLGVAVVSVMTALLNWPSTASTTQRPYLRVAPVANLTGNSDFDYLADALTEHMMSEIARIGAIDIVAAGTPSTPAAEGQYRLVGSLSAADSSSSLRMSVRLEQTLTGSQYWADVIEQGPDDNVEFQSRIIDTTVFEVHRKLVSPEQDRIALAQPANEDVEYMLAEARRLQDAGAIDEAIALLDRTVAIAPESALTHSALARALINAGWYATGDTKTVVSAASVAAWRALEIDPSLSDPHLVLANVAAFYDWNWSDAETHYQMALERNPNHAAAYLDFAAFKIVIGDFDRARELMNLAREIKPRSAATYGQVAILLHLTRDWDQAQRNFDLALEIEPDNLFLKVHKACAYIFEGRLDLAHNLITEVVAAAPDDPFPRIIEAYYNAVADQSAKAASVFAEVDESMLAAMPKLMHTSILVALGRHEEAIDRLEQAEVDHLLALPYTAVHPTHDALRGNPRYQAILGRLGLGGDDREGRRLNLAGQSL